MSIYFRAADDNERYTFNLSNDNAIDFFGYFDRYKETVDLSGIWTRDDIIELLGVVNFALKYKVFKPLLKETYQGNNVLSFGRNEAYIASRLLSFKLLFEYCLKLDQPVHFG